ncbi:DUF4386 family protein [Undibacterium seohonense]|uniref:DUF4386 family protein n=1 Tax=Undibacterium seohonense TaxID=1344950 RepID=A0ABR6X5B0_9BURK|nr:DUF4386 family protein [Undibacterium seohonense]MBC3807833.1 DUF4386 family protein [Undibacterium seohonense]
MMNLQKTAGIAALCEALIYITTFVLYGTVLAAPSGLDTAQKLTFLAGKQSLLFFSNLLAYVIFGILLAVLVLALHERLKSTAATLTQLASIFGVLWAGLVIASGMLANIGLDAVLKLSLTEPGQTRALWLSVTTITGALGGGNEIVGGLWVLLISCAGLKAKVLPTTLHYLGIVVGVAGIATCYPADGLTEIFGLSQIIWFSYLGFALLRQRQD